MHTHQGAEDHSNHVEQWRASVRDFWCYVDAYMTPFDPIGVVSVAKIGRHLLAERPPNPPPSAHELEEWVKWVRYLATVPRARERDLPALNMLEALQAAEQLLLTELGESS